MGDGKTTHACVVFKFDFAYPFVIPIVIHDGKSSSTEHIKFYYPSKPPMCEECHNFGHWIEDYTVPLMVSPSQGRGSLDIHKGCKRGGFGEEAQIQTMPLSLELSYGWGKAGIFQKRIQTLCPHLFNIKVQGGSPNGS